MKPTWHGVEANGLQLRSHGGRCEPGTPGEGAYVPEGGASLALCRSACYVDNAGKAHHLATIPPWVMIQVTGTGSDSGELQSWAWLGNQDRPGNPTVWRELPLAGDDVTQMWERSQDAADCPYQIIVQVG